MPRAINIVPTVLDFGNQSAARLDALARAAGKIAEAAHGGHRFAQMLSPADFAELKAFVAFASCEFALAGSGLARDDAVDRQHSADGYSHFLDLEKL